METIIHNNKFVIFTGTGLIFGHLDQRAMRQIDRVECLFEEYPIL